MSKCLFLLPFLLAGCGTAAPDPAQIDSTPDPTTDTSPPLVVVTQPDPIPEVAGPKVGTWSGQGGIKFSVSRGAQGLYVPSISWHFNRNCTINENTLYRDFIGSCTGPLAIAQGFAQCIDDSGRAIVAFDGAGVGSTGAEVTIFPSNGFGSCTYFHFRASAE